MAIAMKDLEIRGAGNLLGGEQSGHIADVGFDLYVRLVGEAVHEFKGDGEPELGEVRIELPVDAHLPHDYIPSERLRLEMYKRLAEVRADEDVDLLREEMVDRYGEPPIEVRALLLVARFRARARRAGHRRGHHRRPQRAVRARSSCRSRASYASSGCTPRASSSRRSRPSWCRGPSHGDGRPGQPITGMALLEWARGVIDAVIDPPVPNKES